MSEPRDAHSDLTPLRVADLRKAFGPAQALDGVTLEVPRGTTTVLIGPSGSGKSTLLRSINLLERPDSGTLDVGDGPIDLSRPLSAATIRAARRHTGMVFQQFNLFPHLTAEQNVALAPRESLGLSDKDALQRARRLLADVGLQGKEQSFPDRLSGGQQQRVAIARALAMEPDFLLLDEPTSALDPELAAEVVAVLARLSEEGRTLLVVTHSLEFARRVADRVVFLEDGRILSDGTPDDFFASTDPRLVRFREMVGAV